MNSSFTRELTEQIRSLPHTTLSEIRTIAKNSRVEAKVVHNAVVRCGVEIRDEEKRRPERTSRRKKLGPKEVDTVFATFATLPEDASTEPVLLELPDDPVEALNYLVGVESELRADHDKALAELAKVETELVVQRKQVEANRAEAKKAVAQAAKLRRDTKADRERIESLEGDLSFQKRKSTTLTARVEECERFAVIAHEQRQEAIGMARRLLDVMREQEREIAELRDRYWKDRDLVDAAETIKAELDGYRAQSSV